VEQGTVAIPVVLIGSELRSLAGGWDVAASSLRVVGPEGEIPVQLDERDGTGTFVAEPNHVLDNDDELVFQVDRPAGRPATCWLYFSSSPRPLGDYLTDPHFRWQRASRWDEGAPAHAVLRNREFKLGVKGPKSPTPEVNAFQNWGCGGLTVLRYRDHDFVHPASSWTWFVPYHPFAAGPSPYVWSAPSGLVDGPVRKIVRLTLQGFEVRDEAGQVTVAADVVHDVALYARGAVAELEETLHYRAAPAAWTLPYRFPLAFGRAFDSEIRLFTSRNGQVTARSPTAEEIAQVAAGPGAVPYYQSEAGDDPWFGWLNRADRWGLAVFCGPAAGPTPVAQQTGATVRPELSETTLTLTAPGLAAPGTLRVRMRLVGFSEDAPPLLSAHLQAWTGPARAWLTPGAVESP
jgi:hypothetical protein